MLSFGWFARYTAELVVFAIGVLPNRLVEVIPPNEKEEKKNKQKQKKEEKKGRTTDSINPSHKYMP